MGVQLEKELDNIHKFRNFTLQNKKAQVINSFNDSPCHKYLWQTHAIYQTDAHLQSY
jgi:hypothetical protein